jgi:hypothetical protein
MKSIFTILLLLIGSFCPAQSGPFAPSGGSQSLTLNVAGGIAAISTTPTVIAPKTVPLVANTTNYVYVDLSAAAITSNTSGFTTTDYPVATATTNAIQVITFQDVRPGAFSVTGGGGSGSITGVVAGPGLVGGGTSGSVTLGLSVGINTQTASYTLALTDSAALVRMNVASANNLTVPLNSSAAFPVGASVTIRQVGAGTTTIVPASGVTITTPSTLILRVQYSSVQLIQVAANTWDLIGDTQ